MNAIKMGMTIEEAAETSGIGRNTMRKLVDWGKLPVLKVGRKTIIRRDTLERFMTVNQGRKGSIIYSHICHSFLITTFCYIVLRVFSSLDFSLMRSRGKHKQ